MNKLSLIAATISLGALSAIMSIPANAQDAPMATKPMVMSNDTTGKPMIVVPAMASAGDIYKAQWAYRNLDEREVKRFRAEGFSDHTIRGAGNIALRTGQTVEYVLRQVREIGMPLAYIAAMDSISTEAVNADIPGYGTESISVMAAPMTPPSMPMMNRSGMINTTINSTTAMNATTSTTNQVSSASLPAVNQASGTIVDIAMGNPDFSTLVLALKTANLVDMLQGPGPFTVFAPTNAAFAKLPAGTLDNLMKPENASQLRALLQYHVVPGKIMAADIMAMSNPSTPRTESGSTLNVKTTTPVMVNNATVTATDIVANNGVIHVIDTVLMPPAP